MVPLGLLSEGETGEIVSVGPVRAPVRFATQPGEHLNGRGTAPAARLAAALGHVPRFGA